MVLLCYDASATAKRAIPAAYAILADKPATALYVWQRPTEFFEGDWFAGIGPTAGPPIVELEELAVKRAQSIAREGAELARRAGFTAEPRTEGSVGKVWRTIINVADDLKAEVIVVGARGLSPVRSVLLGSVSSAVVHHSTLPVVVVPPADLTDDTRGGP